MLRAACRVYTHSVIVDFVWGLVPWKTGPEGRDPTRSRDENDVMQDDYNHTRLLRRAPRCTLVRSCKAAETVYKRGHGVGLAPSARETSSLGAVLQ